MPDYTRYPAIDENNNFPPEVRAAFAQSSEIVNSPFVLSAASGMVNAAAYGDLEKDLVATVNSAIKILPNHSTIVIPPGTYKTSGIIVNESKSINISAKGARFMQDSSHSLGVFSGSWGSTYRILNIQKVDYTLSEANVRNVHRLTLDAPTLLIPGDIVKIYSNDRIAESRTTVTNLESRHGEMATVFAVSTDGSVVTLSGYLRENYKSNIRLQRLEPVTVNWEGGSFYGSDKAFSSNSTSPVFRFSSMQRPTLKDFTVERASCMAADFRSNFYPVLSNLTIQHLADNASTSQYGYGVMDASNESLTYINSSSRRTRHAYTDDTSRIAPDTLGAERYGRSYNARVVNVESDGSSSGAFSPHHSGANHKFINCTARRSGASGFGMRGINHEIIDCTVEDCVNGATNANEGGGQSYGLRVVNMRSRNVREFHVIDYPNNTTDRTWTMEVIGGLFEGTSIGFANNTNGRLRISGNAKWMAPTSLPDDSSAIRTVTDSIFIDGLELNYRDNISGTNLHVAHQEGGDNKFIQIRNMVVNNANVVDRMTFPLSWKTGGSGNSLWNVDNLKFEVDPKTYSISQGADPASKITWSTLSGDKSSAHIYRENNDVTNPAPFLHQTPLPTIYIQCVATNNVSRTFGALSAGVMIGQMVIITWTHAGTATGAVLNIENDITKRISLPANVALSNGGALSLIWDGNTWRRSNHF